MLCWTQLDQLIYMQADQGSTQVKITLKKRIYLKSDDIAFLHRVTICLGFEFVAWSLTLILIEAVVMLLEDLAQGYFVASTPESSFISPTLCQ